MAFKEEMFWKLIFWVGSLVHLISGVGFVATYLGGVVLPVTTMNLVLGFTVQGVAGTLMVAGLLLKKIKF